jgi:N-methylhydantoinase A
VDTGGTFTDLVACAADGTIVEATKISTTADDPSRGILAALQRLRTTDIGVFLHGTTSATNALLERRGARTALFTTKGFRDILTLARQERPRLYDWFREKSQPLVPRELTVEVEERVAVDNASSVPLDEESLRSGIEMLRELGVESVAVSLLHSYRDGEHERRVGSIIASELDGVHVSLSSEVLPEIGEYERTSTTVANAYLAPVIDRYLGHLLAGLDDAGIAAPTYVMQSSGGLGSARTIAGRAVETVLSGPAAGVIGGLASTTQSEKSGFLTIDMGGTSFDVSYAEQREPTLSRESKIDGLPIAVPALDIHTLGAGGGSIAWIDAGGLLRVGPRSAGSHPGPACYGRGGDEPTVTDANLVLGRLGTDLVGGEVKLDPDAAHRVIERAVAKPLDLSIVEAAQGIIDVVNAAMAKGMHLMSIARGRDPRLLGVVAFGGAGPLHACELAELVDNTEVIIPLIPGNTSALGLTLAEVRRERTAPVLSLAAELDDRTAQVTISDLGAEVARLLAEDGTNTDAIRLDAFARVSYEGQRYHIRIPLPSVWSTTGRYEGSLATLASGFQAQHLAHYGYARKEELWVASLDVVGFARIRDAGGPRLSPEIIAGTAPGPRKRTVWFSGEPLDTLIMPRWALAERGPIDGPAVIVQADTTTVLPPTWQAAADASGNLMLRRGS